MPPKVRANPRECVNERAKNERSLDVSQTIVTKEEEGGEWATGACRGIKKESIKTKNDKDGCEPCAGIRALYQPLLALGREKKTMKHSKETALAGPSDDDDTFYDALDFLPSDVAVEDVSDQEGDKETRSLRSSHRNRSPSAGWMEPAEPLEPDGMSYSTFV